LRQKAASEPMANQDADPSIESAGCMDHSIGLEASGGGVDARDDDVQNYDQGNGMGGLPDRSPKRFKVPYKRGGNGVDSSTECAMLRRQWD
jgi:hypothetical protein